MNFKTIKRTVSIFATIALIASAFTGCGNKAGKTDNVAAESTAAAVTTEATTASGEVTYPIKTEEPITLTYWVELDTKLAQVVTNYAETDQAIETEKRTGIKIKYIHPPTGGDNMRQAFNMMVASKDLPDIIQYNINNLYPGGPEKAIKDKVILPLDNIVAKNSPDLLKLFDEMPMIKKYSTTGSGHIFMYPCTLDESYYYQQGIAIRGDWLEELKLPVPETMDDWYNTLKKFKESGKAEYPLSWSEKSVKLKWSGEFTGAYGVLLGAFQQDTNGKVQFGAALPQYKDFLIEMNKWYKEGLLDPEFALQDKATLRAKAADEKIGAWIDAGSGFRAPNTAWRSKDPNTMKKVIGAPHAVLKKGEKAPFGSVSSSINLNSTAVITTACKYPEIAAQWLNYGYTEEGMIFNNYGVEGKSFKVENGEILGADFILSEPANPTRETSPLNWIKKSGPFKGLKSSVPDSLNADQDYVYAMRNTWKNATNELRMPEIPPMEDKADKYAAAYAEVDTYVDEMFIKFIMGVEPIENFDKYVERLKALGLDECISIQQEVLDDWNKR